MRWKHTFFGLITTLGTLTIVEVSLWAGGVRPLLSERDPFHGFSETVRVFELDGSASVYRTPRRAVLHSFNDQQFLAEKPENGFRFFVMGGSSAYGFPWGAGQAFPRLLADALQASWPDRAVEGINAAAMSYGSHRLRILANELLNHEPDALVIYSGHNEFVERRFYDDVLDRPAELDWIRSVLYRWRLYALLTRGYERARGAVTAQPAEPRTVQEAGELLGLDVVRDYSVDVSDAEREEVRTHFEENLRAILRLAREVGVPVVLCTVPSNLSRWNPNQSVFDRELAAEDRRTVGHLVEEAREALNRDDSLTALRSLKEALRLAPNHAEAHFLSGGAQEKLGRWEEALVSYRRARDLDAQPGRATSILNATIRELGAEPGVLLVDVERDFESASPHGLPGFNLFEDYVHPKPAGHRRIALALWKAFLERGVGGAARPADESVFWAAIGREQDHGTTEDFPQAHAEAKTPSLLFNLGVVLENQGRINEALENYRACLELNPDYFVAHTNLGRLLLRRGRFDEARSEFEQALAIEPRHLNSMMGLGEALRRMGRAQRAEAVFAQATRVDPGSAAAWNSLGVTVLAQGKFGRAIDAFRRAIDLDPDHADTHANLGLALLFQTRLAEAEAAFRACLGLEPEHLGAHNGMAAVLMEMGRLDDATLLYNGALRIDPGNPTARDGLAEIERRRGG